MQLPKLYAWLADEPGPRLLKEMLALYGTVESPGSGNNPMILKWAKSIGLGSVYKSDAVAWCGLTVAYAAAQAGWDSAPEGNALWARNWASWGDHVDMGKAMLGDVLVFARKGGGHVALYVGEDATHYHILGGNQDDCVSIKRRAKAQLIAVRRCPWRVNQPDNVRKVILSAKGEVAKSEA
jgi:uncharacterized protein (TIGR02594 family)